MNPLAGLTGLEHLQQNLNVNYPPRPIASKAAVTTSIPAAVANNVSPRQAQQELQQLLASICDDEPPPPESRVGTPEGLKITLLEHQKVGFQWMSKQEASVNKGGMLTDDMGLGKTIQALAIIVSRRCQDAAALPDPMEMPHGRRKARMEPFKVKTTLVICPVSLMDQWAQEIKYKTENLSVHIHHGTNRLNDPYEVAKYDVIITSYHSATGEFPDDTSRGYTCLNPLIFHRVILDEAHTIKNRTTRAAKACYRINAIHRWCLTATPIQNKLEELFSLIYFLRIRPYCDWDRFRIDIVKPMKNPSSSTNKKVLKKVQVILKAIAIRRSKKAEIDGRPILNLPERNVHMTHVDFESEERQFYNYVDTRIQARFDQYVQSNTVMQNYSSVLVLLLRLRQACLHPSLTHIEKPVLKNDEDQQLESAESLDRKVVERLVNAKDELQTAECPICMDTADDARIIAGCGHILCRECLSAYISSGGNYGGPKTCPQCRGILQMDKTISVPIFIKIHIPELAKEEKKEEVVEEELENDLPSFESSKKIDTMLEILAKTRQESNDKTIIFSQFTSMLDVIERALERDGIKFGRYDGAMSLAGRTKVLENFHNDPAMDVLIVSTKCGSLGLNLTVANRVILMDVWWNPALENQAIDRVHRIGQTKDVHVHRLFINNTVEDRILELQRKKQAIADGAYGEGGAEKIGRLDLQDMLFLFRGDRGR
ncbi:SNF2 family N-terminal domain-containing protein [Chlamydoabsidia padenii]|nr:SNF2 family N-terminal domain-containing protein [Chlamydoabsidia padenii]